MTKPMSKSSAVATAPRSIRRGVGSSRLVLGLVGLPIGLAGVACGANNPSPLVPQTAPDVCGAPPTNVEQDLSQDAQVQIAGYVQAGGGGTNKRRLTQVLGQQGLMCDALAYRSCLAAHAAHATADQMREMMQVALGACASTGGAAKVASGPPDVGVTPSPAPTPPPAPARVETPAPAATPAAPAGDALARGATDWNPGKYMAQAVDLVVNAAHNLEAKSDFGFDGDAACVMGAYMPQGREITMSRPFEAGKEYVIVGGGSEGTVDLDLGLAKPEGGFVASDTDDDATPVVKFTVPKSGTYTLHVALQKAQSGGAFAAVAIMKKGGWAIPTNHLTASFQRALRGAGGASDLVHKRLNAAGLVFHTADDWSFYSIVLKPGESMQYNGHDLPGPVSVVLSAGDDALTSADMWVTDSTTSKEVGRDTEPDQNPVVVVRPEKGHAYSVAVRNIKSSGPSLITTLVLDAESN